LARKLGTHEYLDTGAVAPAEALQKLAGARLILATAPDSKSISALVDGLGGNGKLLIAVAGFDSLSVSPLPLIGGRKTIHGWASGTAKDSEDTLPVQFAERSSSDDRAASAGEGCRGLRADVPRKSRVSGCAHDGRIVSASISFGNWLGNAAWWPEVQDF
jgi:hypothetical protein